MESAKNIISAYSGRASEYAEVLGDLRATKKQDREYIEAWCEPITGKILDLGCGPGHWTNFLAHHGKLVLGIDPVALFIELASQKYSEKNFQLGTIATAAANSYQGILAWYSLIHLTPSELEEELSTINSTLIEGGSLLLGYFRGSSLETFNHAVVEAWYWPDDFITGLLEKTGFIISHMDSRKDLDAKPHGAIIAIKK